MKVKIENIGAFIISCAIGFLLLGGNAEAHTGGTGVGLSESGRASQAESGSGGQAESGIAGQAGSGSGNKAESGRGGKAESGRAGQAGGVTISGIVTSVEDGTPIDFANVIVLPSNSYAITDKGGKYSIGDIPAGKITVSFQFFGMETKDTTFTANAGSRINLNMALKESSFRLDNVVVTATQSKAGKSTASTISRQAMDHMQTSSLHDVMALLPGMNTTNPSLSQAQSFTIRNAGGTSSSVSMNSLGTAIIVDGAPLSNNANMQVLSTTQTGSTSIEDEGASVTAGIDIRSLSTDNVESVEVIRGIPSVEYGDMTSGAVIVKSKAGRSPLTIRFKTNPNIYQVSAAKGLSLGKKRGDLNISGDYAYNQNTLTKSFRFYQRANAKALWSVMFAGNSTANTSLSLNFGRDRSKLNPDEAGAKAQSYANEVGVQFNSNGHAFINKGWFKAVNWLVSGSYNNKVSHVEDLATNAMNLYSTAMTDGLVYTNYPGLSISTDSGKPITNLAGNTSIAGTILPYSYFYEYDVFGKEVNAFAKLNAEFGKSWTDINEKILIGADFKTDGNLGKGSVYDDAAPPFRNIGNAESGYRRRAYSEIPFVNQIGLYAEEHFNWRFAERELNLTAGARFDWVNGLTSLAPRVNASIDAFPWMTIRGGWGITAKAPTTLMLNPNNAYLDMLNFNGMSNSTPEAERLLVATTRVFDASNPNLEIAQNRKAEIGLDFRISGKYRVSLTGYDEYMDNGYNFGLGLDSFVWYQMQTYTVAQNNPGSVPTLTEGNVYNMFFSMFKPRNSVISHNSGVEYEIDLGRIDAIRTAVSVNGAWMRSSVSSNDYTYSTRTNGGSPEYNIGMYNPEMSTTYSDRLNSSLRLTHNIPNIGFVITLTGQFNWYTKSWNEFKNDEMFVKYISYKDGQVHDFDPAMKNDPEFSYMFPTLSDTRFAVEKYFPTTLFNINVSKEIGDWLTASFYVNNLFNHRPLYKTAGNGTKIELNIPMYFGFEFKVAIK